MSHFLDMAVNDNIRVFTNTNELGSRQTIRYDGQIYADIQVTLTKPTQCKRDSLSADHMQGVYHTTVLLNCIKADLKGVIPEQGSRLSIERKRGYNTFFEEFTILAVNDEFGLLRMELEALDE